MSSISIDLIAKAYQLSPEGGPTTISSARPLSIVNESSSRRPSRRASSRKSSVHDISESIREDLLKRMTKIHVDLSEWKCSFELVDCCSLDVSSARLIELRDDLLVELNEMIERFCQQAEKRGSIHSIGKTRFNVEHFVSLIEYLRNELLKMKYVYPPLDNSLLREIDRLEEQSSIFSQRYFVDVPSWTPADELRFSQQKRKKKKKTRCCSLL